MFQGGGGEVKVGNDGSRRVVDQMGGALHFRPVKKDDEGMYICRAFNDVGHVDSQGRLEVIGENFNWNVEISC